MTKVCAIFKIKTKKKDNFTCRGHGADLTVVIPLETTADF